MLKPLTIFILLHKQYKFITMLPKFDNMPLQPQRLIRIHLNYPFQQISVHHHLTVIQIEQFKEDLK